MFFIKKKMDKEQQEIRAAENIGNLAKGKQHHCSPIKSLTGKVCFYLKASEKRMAQMGEPQLKRPFPLSPMHHPHPQKTHQGKLLLTPIETFLEI